MGHKEVPLLWPAGEGDVRCRTRRPLGAGRLTYARTLFSTTMLVVLMAHTLEDVVLLSIGRFLPVPVWAMYAIGLGLSWLVMGRILQWVQRN